MNYAAVVEALSGEGFELDEDAARQAEYRARVRLDPILAQRRSTEAPEIFKTYLRLLCEGLGLRWGAATERAFHRIEAYNRRVGLWDRPDPQAADVLRELCRRDLTLGMVSNSDGRIERIVAAHGLRPFFRFVLDSRVVGVEKPDPRIFRLALAQAEAEPEEAVYVGDLYSIDVVGARAAGLDAILLDPAGLWGRVDCRTARDLAEAASLVCQTADRGRA
jgi:putative hydrolase of the HAD superfamily